jgi:hypothetical protein
MFVMTIYLVMERHLTLPALFRRPYLKIQLMIIKLLRLKFKMMVMIAIVIRFYAKIISTCCFVQNLSPTTLLPNDSFSPESGGNVNPNNAIEAIKTQGTIKLKK